MSEKRFLYFLLGVLSVVSMGAVKNQILPVSAPPLALRSDGIQFPDGTVQTTAAAGRRSFYLTTTVHDGAGAPSACTTGYHMASMWEILDPTQLTYNTALGFTRDDSAEGPPAAQGGWIRTGFLSFSSQLDVGLLGDGGARNCDAYTSNDPEKDGTVVQLNSCWQEARDCSVPDLREQALATWWLAGDGPCSAGFLVWCVEDLS